MTTPSKIARRLGAQAALVSMSLASSRAAAQAPAPPPALPGGVATPQGVVIPPRLKADPGVRYPERALQDRFFETVTVVLLLEVDAGGAVRKAAVEEAHAHGFDEAAVAAAEKLQFEPALRDGTPVATRFRFRYVFRPPPARLSGRVARRDTDAPLASATVIVRAADGAPRTATTRADGSWDVGDAPRGPAHLTVTLPGYDSETADAELTPGEETRVVVRLSTKAGDGASRAGDAGPPALEVQVRGERPPREVTKRTLHKEEIELIPGTRGDSLLSLQSLPGVARPPPFSGQLAVRGSAPEDTNTFVDGTLVPLVYHFGGLSSVVPSELLAKIDFYPGNYSATYGRGMGGVIDVGIRDPKEDGLHGMAQIDLIDARILAEGPIGKGFSFLIAGRRSWFDAWLGPVLSARSAGVSTVPRYYDYQVLIEKRFSATHDVRLLFFGSDDALDILNQSPNASNPTFGGDLTSHISFWRLQARYRNRFDDRTELSAVAAVGQDSRDLGIGSNFSNDSEIPVSGRIELTQKVVRGVTANVGLDLVYSPYHLEVRLPPPTRPGVPSGGPLDMPLESTDSGSRFFPGVYTEWELVPRAGTRVVPAIRVDWSSSTRSWDFSPRINLRQELTRGFPHTTLKGGVGLFYQPPQPLETDPVFGQRGLSSNRSVQSDVGVNQELTRQIDLSVDVFYKYLDHLVTRGAGNAGEGFAYGAEWFLRYRPDEHFFGWIAYTLSRSERRGVPADPWSLSSYDQTHILNFVGSYNFGSGWRLGARFRVVSGNPYTPNNEGAYDATTGAYQAAPSYPINGARLAPFHQLDVRLDKVWSFKRWKLTTYLDIQNVYNYRSPVGVSYNYDYTQSAPVAGLPILPSLGLRGEL